MSELRYCEKTGWDAWTVLQAKCRPLPVSYLPSYVQYQNQYFSEAYGDYSDRSAVIYQENEAIGLWPMAVYKKDGQWQMGWPSYGVLPPVFASHIGEKLQKKIIAELIEEMHASALKLEIGTLNFYHDLETAGGEFFYRQILEMGGSALLLHEMIVDLSRDLEAIHSSFRASYKSLINKGLKIWNCEIHRKECSAEVFESFRQLHIKVAGRETRSKRTWDLQFDAIKKSESFLITMKNETQEMIGAGLFLYTPSEGRYAVAAYDRSLFDQPIGHVAQSLAIKELKNLGVSRYVLGNRQYPQDRVVPSDKELSISKFKEGFMSGLRLIPVTQLKIVAKPAVSST